MTRGTSLILPHRSLAWLLAVQLLLPAGLPGAQASVGSSASVESTNRRGTLSLRRVGGCWLLVVGEGQLDEAGRSDLATGGPLHEPPTTDHQPVRGVATEYPHLDEWRDYYFRMRTYVPEWGSFSGPDREIDMEGNGPENYLFAGNNPLVYLDPLGLQGVMRALTQEDIESPYYKIKSRYAALPYALRVPARYWYRLRAVFGSQAHETFFEEQEESTYPTNPLFVHSEDYWRTATPLAVRVSGGVKTVGSTIGLVLIVKGSTLTAGGGLGYLAKGAAISTADDLIAGIRELATGDVSVPFLNQGIESAAETAGVEGAGQWFIIIKDINALAVSTAGLATLAAPTAPGEGAFLFRGTTKGFPGSEGLQKIGITPTSTDPAVATVFATEASNFGEGVVLIARFRGLPTVPGNVLAALESEVGVALKPVDFAAGARAIPLTEARAALGQVGVDIPRLIGSKAALRDVLRSTSRLTPQQIQEFLRLTGKAP